MSKITLEQLSDKMREIDLCMMSTVTVRGMLASRPMSNNSDVKYDGTSYFFTEKKSRLVSDIKKNKNVNLAFTNRNKLFVSVTGNARLTSDQKEMESHWNPDLDKWFKKGVKTPGVVMIEVKAKAIKLWQGEDEVEVTLK